MHKGREILILKWDWEDEGHEYFPESFKENYFAKSVWVGVIILIFFKITSGPTIYCIRKITTLLI